MPPSARAAPENCALSCLISAPPWRSSRAQNPAGLAEPILEFISKLSAPIYHARISRQELVPSRILLPCVFQETRAATRPIAAASSSSLAAPAKARAEATARAEDTVARQPLGRRPLRTVRRSLSPSIWSSTSTPGWHVYGRLAGRHRAADDGRLGLAAGLFGPAPRNGPRPKRFSLLGVESEGYSGRLVLRAEILASAIERPRGPPRSRPG